MYTEIFFESEKLVSIENDSIQSNLQQMAYLVSDLTGVPEIDLYATQNGRRAGPTLAKGVAVRWHVRLVGGKGGFGSMLRAIGAQIEKTTNREACRDLSGRRLRDIREEKRLRGWAAARPQREEEAKKRKKDRLNRLCAVPSHEFHDEQYETARRGLEEAGGAAVDAGHKAHPPAVASKPAAAAKEPSAKKRKCNLWIDDDLSDLSSSQSGSEDEQPAVAAEEKTVSGKGKGKGKRSHPDETSPLTHLTASNASNASDSGNESDLKTFLP